MNFNFNPLEVDELYLRASAMELPGWEGSPEEGVYFPGWVADFSENMFVGLYQEKTIRQWFDSQPETIERKRMIRGTRYNQRIDEINKRIEDRKRRGEAK